MRAAGNPGTVEFECGKPRAFRRTPQMTGWIVVPVDREDFDGPKRYEPGLLLSVDGTFHRLDNELRGWGQRDFPRYEHRVSPEPVEPPDEARAERGARAAGSNKRAVMPTPTVCWCVHCWCCPCSPSSSPNPRSRATTRWPVAYTSVAHNPADALAELPIEEPTYDPATRCSKRPKPGMTALVDVARAQRRRRLLGHLPLREVGAAARPRCTPRGARSTGRWTSTCPPSAARPNA